MKKLAKLTALLLTGVMLLLLASCGAAPNPLTPEQQAKQWLLEEINSYRASLDPSRAPLVEVKQLSAAEQVWVEQFRTARKTVLTESETQETYWKWEDMTKDWTYYGSLGWGKGIGEDDWTDYLDAKVPANTPAGKAELWAALKDHSVFNSSNCTSIGIAVVTIDGQMYWACTLYAPKT